MSSRLVIRALGAGLVLLFLVGSARAGELFSSFSECDDPSAVPTTVLGTIEFYSSFGFGDLSAKVCDSIVKKGVSLCKAQVKLAAKCNDKTVSSLNDILLKQCAELPDATDRANCKAGVKEDVAGVKADTKTNRDTGIAACEGAIADTLAADCANGVPL